MSRAMLTGVMLAAVVGLGACASSAATPQLPTDPIDAAQAGRPAAEGPAAPDSPAVATTAAADQSPAVAQDPALTTAQRQAYRAALASGRARHRDQDYRGALEAFREALAVYPDDPRALSELGWAAFFAKDLALAEQSTRDAIQRTADANLRGASLYNLGRIQEELGQPDEAVVSYERSLRVRPNATVLERLGHLNAAVAERFAVFQPAHSRGPYASLEAVCAALLADNTYLDSPFCRTESPDLGEVQGPTQVSLAEPPYGEARLVMVASSLGDDHYPMEAEYALAVRLGEDWFVSRPIAYVYNPGAFGIFEGLTVVSMALEDAVPGGTPELVVRLEHDRTDSDLGLNEVESEHAEFLLVCGVGKSGVPSCVGPIPLAASHERTILFEEDEADQDAPVEHLLGSAAWRTTARFLDTGELELAPESGEPHAVTLGRHALAFP